MFIYIETSLGSKTKETRRYSPIERSLLMILQYIEEKGFHFLQSNSDEHFTAARELLLADKPATIFVQKDTINIKIVLTDHSIQLFPLEPLVKKISAGKQESPIDLGFYLRQALFFSENLPIYELHTKDDK